MTQTTAENSTRIPTPIDAIAESHAENYRLLLPEMDVHLGLPGRETEYGDYSPVGIDALAALNHETLKRLEDVAVRDETDAVTKDALQERLGLELEFIQSGQALAQLNNIASAAQGIREVFDLMPTDTPTHWQHIAGRMRNVPDAITGYIASLTEAKNRGLIAAARQVRNVIEQAERIGAEDGFFAELAANASATEGELSDELRTELSAAAEDARSAYNNLAVFLTEVLLPDAPEKDAVGRERYALASRDFLGAKVDLDDTYAWGVAELDRIIAEQEKVANQIKPGASIDEAIEILNNDPARKLRGAKALQEWMQQLSDRALKELGETHFDIIGPMNKLECMIAPTHEGGIYYTPPSDDFARAGRMWWSIPEGEDEFLGWQETTTVYHEGVPGHHLQCATAIYNKDELNNWRRNFCWVSGHGEGWALYAERLMDELGYLSDPGDKMGMLSAQRMRAARVVFDIGVHLELEVPERWGSGTWDPDKGYEFLRQNFAVSKGQLDFEFNRYLGWPGQAPSYKVGQRLWEQIRDQVKEREGENFDLKAFHTRALKLGSVGLDTLKRALVPEPTPES